MAERLELPRFQVFDSNGDPLAGAKLYAYVTGTSTPLDTYSDNALTVANANPVVADSAGRFGDIFLSNADYKLALKTSADVTVWTADPVHGGAANPLFSSILVDSGNDTLDSSDSGKLIAVTATATITLPAATVGTSFRVGIVNAGAGIVTVARAGSDTFENGQTAVRLAPSQGCFFQPDATSKWYTIGKDGRGKGADVASANALNIGQDGHYFHVTGTTTITSIEARPRGWEIVLVFDGALILTHNASTLIMPGAANFTTADGDTITFTAEDDSGAWRCTAVALAGSIGFDISALTDDNNPANTATVAISLGAGSGNNRKTDIAEVGAYCFLATQTASASASIDFDLETYPNYKHFVVEAYDIIPGTDAVNLFLRFATDGAGTFENGVADYGWTLIGTSSAGIGAVDPSDSEIQLNITTLGSTAGETFDFTLKIHNPAGTALRPRAMWNAWSWNSTPHPEVIMGMGARLANQKVTDIQFIPSSGNIASGVFALYGIRG